MNLCVWLFLCKKQSQLKRTYVFVQLKSRVNRVLTVYCVCRVAKMWIGSLTTGILCHICIDGFYRSKGVCVECPGFGLGREVLLAIFTLALILMILFVLCKYLTMKDPIVVKFRRFMKSCHMKMGEEAAACRIQDWIRRVQDAQRANAFPLHRAARIGNVRECTRLLLGMGMGEVDTRNFDRHTALHIAAVNGKPEVCRILIEAGAELNCTVGRGSTPLHLAASAGHIEACHVLILACTATEVDTQDDFQNTALHRAAKKGHIDVCCMLIDDGGAEIEARAHQDFVPLHCAVLNGHTELCRVLVKYGANVNAEDDNGTTPLHITAMGIEDRDDPQLCAMLIEARGDVRHTTWDEQQTPLHYGAMSGTESVCLELVRAGADVYALDHLQETPAQSARHRRLNRPRNADSEAQEQHRNYLADRLEQSGGVHYFRCTGPSLERQLVWNDASAESTSRMCDGMQVQWLAKVEEACGHSRMGSTVRGMHSGRLPTHSLVQIMQFAFGGTRAHSLSGVLAGRVPRSVLDEFVERCELLQRRRQPGFGLSKYRHKPCASIDTGAGTGEEQLPVLSPRLALVSHTIAHQLALIADKVQGMAVEDRTEGTVLLLETVALLVSAVEAMGDGSGAGCVWLRAYCEFVRRRFHRGS
jgi:ankyrin repeat protein